MLTRRVLWGTIIASTVFALCAAAGLTWVLLRPAAAPAALLVADAGPQLRLLVDGQAMQVISDDHRPAQYRFPVVAPDGGRIAYVGTSQAALAVVVHDLKTGERRQVYTSAVAQPFDLGWSPDGRSLVFLVPVPGGFVFEIVPADGSAEAQTIAAGPTIYYSWSQDGRRLAIHIGGHAAQKGRVDLYKLGDSAATPLLSDPSFFEAPAFSRDGSALFYVAQPPAKQARLTFDEVAGTITRVDLDGHNPQVLASEKQAALQVVRSPTSDVLAYGVRHISADGSFESGGLKLINGDGGSSRTLSRSDQHVTAFFWSPDGQQIAYLSYKGAASTSGAQTWSIVDLADSIPRDLASFTPSQSFAELNQYFDAYTYGYSPWSPDGKRLAYAADNGVYIADARTGKTIRVGDGTITMWAGGRTNSAFKAPRAK